MSTDGFSAEPTLDGGGEDAHKDCRDVGGCGPDCPWCAYPETREPGFTSEQMAMITACGCTQIPELPCPHRLERPENFWVSPPITDAQADAFAEVLGGRPVHAATVRFLTGVQQGWHAIDAAPFPGCGEHAWALCGAIALVAGDEYQPYNPADVPVSHDPCPACRWEVAARTGDFDSALAELENPLARAVATAILKSAAKELCHSPEWRDELDDPAMVQLLAQVAAHCPVLLVTEEAAEEGGCLGCADPPCHGCSGTLACKACSLQQGSWAGEWEGQYRGECTIGAPCAVLLALAEHAGVKS